MEDYKTEKDYCIKMGYHPNDKQEQDELAKMFFEYKQHLIDKEVWVPAEKWINVKDKLPNNRTYVVIHWTCGYDIAEYKHGCFFTGLDKIIGVTHWQEITAPGEHNTKS